MTVTLQFSTPADGGTDVSLTAPLTVSLTSNAAPLDLNSINVSIQGILAVVAGTVQPGFLGAGFQLSTTITPIFGGEQLDFTVSPAGSYNSFEIIPATIQVDDSSSPFSQTISFTTEDVLAPIYVDVTPAPLSIGNSTNTPIFFRIEDQGSGAQLSTLDISINVTTDAGMTNVATIVGGNIVSGFNPATTSMQPIGGSIDVYLQLLDDFPSGSQVDLNLSVQDENNTTNAVYTFYIVDLEAPAINALAPLPDSINVNESTTIAISIIDPNGDGVDLDSVNIKVNNIAAVTNGVAQISYAAVNQIIALNGYVFVISPIGPLPSASVTTVHAEVTDFRGTAASLDYEFTVRDFRAPDILYVHPPNGSTDILPRTNMSFTISEDVDGYGVDLNQLYLLVDGYSVNTEVIDGYEDTIDFYGLVDGYNVLHPVFDAYGTYIPNSTLMGSFNFEKPYSLIQGQYVFPPIYNSMGDLLFRGFEVVIAKVSKNKFDVVINPAIGFDFNSYVALQISITDQGGYSNSASSLFQIADQDELLTIAIPDTGTYKNFLDGYGLMGRQMFLYESGVILQTNLPNTRTYYTLDGSIPSIDAFGNVRGNTRLYTKPILLQREGMHAIKFFSVDSAGNQESLKQEIYMIKPLPPDAFPVTIIPIVADIVLKTRIIPVQTTALFKEGMTVKILDNIRPPVFTKILSVNSTTNPPFIIVEDEVERLNSDYTADPFTGEIILKSSPGRAARVVVIPPPIDPASPVEFDTTATSEFLYVGSDTSGLNQADSVLEQMRILNVASTNEEILADFTLLAKGARFTNQEVPATLSSIFSTLEKKRSNLSDNTLVLLDFDGSVENKPRQGVLKSNTIAIRDKALAGNTIVFTIYVKRGTFVDRELLRNVLRNFTPVDLQIRVEFIEVD